MESGSNEALVCKLLRVKAQLEKPESARRIPPLP